MPLDVNQFAGEDLSRYWDGTWVTYDGEPVRIEHVDSEGEAHIVNVHGDGQSVSMQDLDLSMPYLSVHNTRNSVVHLSSQPRRQWKKAFRLRGVDRIHPFHTVESLLMCPETTEQDIVLGIFKPSYYTLDDALRSIMSGERIACALNQDFYVGVQSDCNHPVVGYKTSFIGHLDDNNKLVLGEDYQMLSPLVSELMEVSDAG